MNVIESRTDTYNVIVSKGLLWLTLLNIIFSLWLIARRSNEFNILYEAKNCDLDFLYVCSWVIAIAVINLFIHYISKKTRSNNKLLEFIFIALNLIQSTLWAYILFKLARTYSDPLISFILASIILLPATIAFYISSIAFITFVLPPLISLCLIEIVQGRMQDLTSSSGVMILIFVVFSARHILLEWYIKCMNQHNENKKLIKCLKQLAETDSLTGLRNRRAMYSFFDNIINNIHNGLYLHAIVIDIDFFKQYNDMYGHIAGDECLSRVATYIESTIDCDASGVFRYGGEEFIILTGSTDIDNHVKITHSIQCEIKNANMIHEGSSVSKFITLSIGVAEWKTGLDFERLLEYADKALYKAKRKGRNRVEFFS
jgi:diguanylate cyclase (GGDEF)-like protein